MKITVDKKRIAKTAVIVCMFFMVAQILFSIYLITAVDYSQMIDQYKVDIGTDFFGMILCLILLYSSFQDDFGEWNERALARLITVIGFALFINLAEGFCELRSDLRLLTKILVTMEYIFDDLILLAFWEYIYSDLSKKKRYKFMNWICLVTMAASIIGAILNFIFESYFYVDQNGNLIENSGFVSSEIMNYLILLIIGILIIRSKRNLREKLILLSFEVFPVFAIIATDLRFSYSIQNISFLLSVVLIYINIYQGRKKKIAEQENRLTQQNMALMISQIQPHFLYNTLTTISNLCVKDPEQAEETTVMFAQYLRGNLDSLRITEPVPFMKELDHIRIYVELEQRRFGEKLNVIYDIQDTNFLVPSLGLQPIVENSIKHGICKKTEAGNLLITTKRTENGHVVIIEDDGVGFDPQAPIAEDGRSHVGMSNVRSRLERMCGATMEIISAPGEGCCTRITIPD